MEIRGIAQGKPQQVIFDLAHVTVLDSTGVGILVIVLRQAQKGRRRAPSIGAANGMVDYTLRIPTSTV
jgi:ABC-type transporter Mla MlaB component